MKNILLVGDLSFAIKVFKMLKILKMRQENSRFVFKNLSDDAIYSYKGLKLVSLNSKTNLDFNDHKENVVFVLNNCDSKITRQNTVELTRVVDPNIPIIGMLDEGDQIVTYKCTSGINADWQPSLCDPIKSVKDKVIIYENQKQLLIDLFSCHEIRGKRFKTNYSTEAPFVDLASLYYKVKYFLTNRETDVKLFKSLRVMKDYLNLFD